MGGDVMHIWLRNMSLLGNRITKRSESQTAGAALAGDLPISMKAFEERGSP